MPDAADMPGGFDPFDDDASWLAADFVPESRGAITPTPESPAQSVLTPLAQASVPFSDLTPKVPPDPVSPRLPVAAKPQTSWIAVGSAFQPLPGGPLLTRTDTVPPAARAIAEPGMTVHAVLAGTLHRSGQGMELRADDGQVVGYRGDAVVQWTAGDGEQLPAGAIIGWVSASASADPVLSGRPSATSAPAAAPPTMRFYLQGADGMAVDPVGWLAGLADPRELGLSGGIAGGVDPFLIDLRLAGHLDGPDLAS